jgi:hypothetical protein
MNRRPFNLMMAAGETGVMVDHGIVIDFSLALKLFGQLSRICW